MKISLIGFLQRSEKWSERNFGSFFKWTAIGIIIGAIVGLIGSAFNFSLVECALMREKHPWVITLLPICGVGVVGVYKLLRIHSDKGTNMVLMAVRDGDQMTWRNTVSIFIGSVLTHLGGGSAGREGAALQIGGSVGSQIGLWLKLDEQDHRLITMCGMSAGFSALFGTPCAAALFSMEVISVGIMHYSAIVPCAAAAVTGYKISALFGVAKEDFLVLPPGFSVPVFLKTAALAVLCGMLSIVFCYALRGASNAYKKLIKNHYLRIIAGGAAVVLLTFLIGTYDYNGAGSEVIKRAFLQRADAWEFILKLLFTALTLGAGYKGGEILPVFFVGSTFGSFAAPLLGLDYSFGAAVGLCGLFCGVTNCPITAFVLSIELFGAEMMPLFVVACGVSYMLSGYIGLYSEQKIVYSKHAPRYIDKKVGKQ